MLKLATATTSILLLGLSATITLGDMVRIKDAAGLIELSNKVNSGISHNGTTVILDGDIDFTGELSKQFDPIGNIYDRFVRFEGSFDGQGYTISNLKMKNNLPCVGLFGSAGGFVSIRNVVIDSTCSFETNFTLCVDIGGIVGEYYGYTGQSLTIENCINMASLSFTETTSNYLYMGGIVGDLSISDSSYIRNCVNYGTITFSGTVTGTHAYIGGIIGDYSGDFRADNFLHNSINYGTISVSGTAETIYIGGLTGYDYLIDIRNNLIAGSISIASSASLSTSSTGIVSGYTFIKGNISNCHWTSDAGSYDASGNGESTVTSSSLITSNDETLSEFNTNAATNSWCKWILIADSAAVSLQANSDGNAVEFTSTFALIPVFESSWKSSFKWFDGENEFVETSVSESKALTGKWTNNVFKLTFDLGNGTSVVEDHAFGDPVTFPEFAYISEESFCDWDKVFDEMPGEDTVVYGFCMNLSDAVKVMIENVRVTEEEQATEILKQYTDSEFEIISFEWDTNYANATVKFPNTTETAYFAINVVRNQRKYGKVTIIEMTTDIPQPPYHGSSSSWSSSSSSKSSSSSSSKSSRSSFSKSFSSSSSLDSEHPSFSLGLNPLSLLFLLW